MVCTWLAVFFFAKLFFLLNNTDSLKSDIYEFPRIWWQGLSLDLSMTGYLIAIPLLLLLFVNLWPNTVRRITKIYTVLIGCFVAIILAADPFFFLYWGQKVNLSFTQFLGAETAGVISISWKYYVLFALFLAFLIYRYKKKWSKRMQPPSSAGMISTLLAIGFCFLMIRGGIGKVPISVSNAFYSNNSLHNNTAVNAVWNFVSIELEAQNQTEIAFFTDEYATSLMANVSEDTTDYSSCIEFTDSTNVIIIMMESFVGKLSAELSGSDPSYMPNIDALKSESVWFNNAYTSSFRSDKGLLALTHGIPSLGRQTLTNFSGIIQNKPSIFTDFGQKGYQSMFYYGGSLDFANMRCMFLKVDDVKGKSDYSSKVASPWGAHDEVVLGDFYDEFSKKQGKQLAMVFSISSHEPFKVPYHKYDKEFENSVAYADSCFGVLISNLKSSEKWKNTLILITADHGTIKPDNISHFDPRNFRVPMLLCGGAVVKDTVVNEIVSQANIPSTFNQLLGQENNYPLEKSLLTPRNEAYYSFNEGVSVVAPNCEQQFDIYRKGFVKDSCSQNARAYFQLSTKAFFTP